MPLLKSELALLKAVINNAPEGIVIADKEARVLLTNPAADKLYARPVPFGKPYESHAELHIVHPDGTPYDPHDLPLTRSALDGEVYTNAELAIIWPDGQKRDLLVHTAPLRDDEGNIMGAVGVFQDITERKHIEEQLRKALEDINESRKQVLE